MRLRLLAGFSCAVVCITDPRPAAAQDPVRIVNTPLPVVATNPLPVVTISPPFQPVQGAITLSVPAPAGEAGQKVIYTVPQGKILVIEYVEGSVGWKITAGGSTVDFDPGDRTGRIVRFYADPGTRVIVYVIRQGHPSGESARFSGHLIDR
jgi:hypothetical protein